MSDEPQAPDTPEPVGGELIMLPGPKRAAPLADDWDETQAPESQRSDGLIDPGEPRPPPAHELEAAVEALLLATEGPVSDRDLDTWLANPGLHAVRASLAAVKSRLAAERRGFQLVEVSKGWQLRSSVRFAPWVAAMRGGRPLKLSKAALETLSIVAYRQPVTRSDIEQLRGVDPGGVLRMLAERGLVTTMGRKEEPGRPLLYGTTRAFLTMFGLRDLSELPTLADLRSMRRDDPRDDDAGSDDDSPPIDAPL